MAKVDDNIFPKIIAGVQTTDPAAPVDGSWKLYAKAGGIYARSSNTISGPLGSAGANNYSGVVWSSGTSMPGGPSTNDRITRTDLARDFYYDGTRWLSVEEFTVHPGAFDGSATAVANGWPETVSGGVVGRMSLWSSDFAVYVTKVYASTYVATTNNGSNYWTVSLISDPGGGTVTTFNTSADTASTHTGHSVTVNSALAGTVRVLSASAAKTGSPGGLYAPLFVVYRLIGV